MEGNRGMTLGLKVPALQACGQDLTPGTSTCILHEISGFCYLGIASPVVTSWVLSLGHGNTCQSTVHGYRNPGKCVWTAQRSWWAQWPECAQVPWQSECNSGELVCKDHDWVLLLMSTSAVSASTTAKCVWPLVIIITMSTTMWRAGETKNEPAESFLSKSCGQVLLLHMWPKAENWVELIISSAIEPSICTRPWVWSRGLEYTWAEYWGACELFFFSPGATPGDA